MNHTIVPLAVYNLKEYTKDSILEGTVKSRMYDFAETLFGEYLKQDLSINNSFFFHFIELKYATQVDIDPSLERFKIHFNPMDLMDYCKEFRPAITNIKDNNYIYSYKDELVTVPKKTFLKKKKDFNKAVEECCNNLEFPALTFHVIELAGRTYSFYTLER